MHIETLRLWSFRSFAPPSPGNELFGPMPVEVTLEPETSVFIGRNGAGKSTARTNEFHEIADK